MTHADSEQVLFTGHPAVLPGVGSLVLCVVTLGLALLVFFVRSRAKFFRITNQRVVVEHGLFSKRMEQVDLYRIVDYVVERPFGQRVLGTGNLILEAMDSSTPALRLDALPTDVVKLYEALRAATEEQRRVRNVRVVDFD